MLAATAICQTRIVPCATRIQRASPNLPFKKSAFIARPDATAKALPHASFILDLAEGAPGSVDAPIGVVVGLAVVISAAALLIFSFGLKPGADAASEMQARDSKTKRFKK